MYWAEFHEPGYTNPDRTAEDLYQAVLWYYAPWPHLDDMLANRQAASDVSMLVYSVGSFASMGSIKYKAMF